MNEWLNLVLVIVIYFLTWKCLFRDHKCTVCGSRGQNITLIIYSLNLIWVKFSEWPPPTPTQPKRSMYLFTLYFFYLFLLLSFFIHSFGLPGFIVSKKFVTADSTDFYGRARWFLLAICTILHLSILKCIHQACLHSYQLRLTGQQWPINHPHGIQWFLRPFGT